MLHFRAKICIFWWKKCDEMISEFDWTAEVCVKESGAWLSRAPLLYDTRLFHLLNMPFTRYFNKDEPPYLVARLVGFSSIHLRLQGNVAIPDAKIHFPATFATSDVIFQSLLTYLMLFHRAKMYVGAKKITPCLTTEDDYLWVLHFLIRSYSKASFFATGLTRKPRDRLFLFQYKMHGLFSKQ